MKAITLGLTILLVIFGTSSGRPSSESKDESVAVTTPESIETIFQKYDQQYPFHGGAASETDAVQNDEPAVEAIIEQLNEIIHDEKHRDFQSPNPDSTLKQRRLLRQQNEELGYGSVHLNRRVEKVQPMKRVNADQRSDYLDLEQNVFFNKDLLADTRINRPVDRVPVKSRITSTRFPARRPVTTKSTTTTEAPVHYQDTAAVEKINELIADSLLTKPEGNKLSIPVLSVATEDFEEDQPEVPVVTTKKPNKVSAQTHDFDDDEEEPRKPHRPSPKPRQRRDSGSYEWLSRMAGWFNFYGESEDVEVGRKMSALTKRQTIDETPEIAPLPVADPAAEAVTSLPEPVPVPEQVKSVDVPPQVSDAVIETILDIDDPQTRSEFAKDVPAIEDKLDELEEQAESNQTTVEVSLVELGQNEAEKLGTVIEEEPETIDPAAILPDLIASPIEQSRSLESTSVIESEPIADPNAAIVSPAIDPPAPAELEAVITTTTAPEIIPAIVEDQLGDAEGLVPIPENNNADIELIPVPELRLDSDINSPSVEVIVPGTTSGPEDTPVSTSIPTSPDDNITLSAPVVSNESVPRGIAEPTPIEEPIEEHNIPLIPAPESDAADIIPAVDTVPVIMIFENKTVTIEVPGALPSATTSVVENGSDDPRIVIEPEVDEEPPMPRLLPVSSTINAVSEAAVPIEETPAVETPEVSVKLTEIVHHNVEEAVLLTDTEAAEPKKAVEDPTVPLIVTEEHAIIPVQTIEPVQESHADVHSDSESQSMSTTESTSELDLAQLGNGSSEEQDASTEEGKAEKIRRKEEKRRLKEEKERLKKEEKARKKALEKSSSEEVDAHNHHIHLNAGLQPEVEERLTKEQMVDIFSSPEKDIETRRLVTATEVKSADPTLVISEVVETQKSVTVDHVVIKKGGVAAEDEDNSVESGENMTTIAPELIEQLDAALEREMESVVSILKELDNALNAELPATSTEAAAEMVATATIPAKAEVTNSAISSKNTRHLAVGYNGEEYVEKDVLPDVAEARLADENAVTPESASTDSRAFVLVGSCLFLITGFILFSLVVLLVKRSGRHGSLDLTIEP